jgi:type VI secretion system lysozyme-like protein
MYGLPDFTALSLLRPHDYHRIRRAVEQAITTFESRLTRVRVTLGSAQEQEHSLHFRIDALLHLKPEPEPVTFDAVLHLHTRRYTVRGHQ